MATQRRAHKCSTKLSNKVPVHKAAASPSIRPASTSSLYCCPQSPLSWRNPCKPKRQNQKQRKEELPAFLTEVIVQQAIESLYDDRIRPLLPDLVQRIKCLTKGCESTFVPYHEDNRKPTVLPKKSINSIMNGNNLNFLEAVFIQPSASNRLYEQFVDPHDPRNLYSDVVWRSFWSFILSRLSSQAISNDHDATIMPYQFKGGRYGLATELQNSSYPSLTALKLGELCHLVQLAIDGGLLAYEKSVLQPVAACRDLCGLRLIKELQNGEPIFEQSSRLFQEDGHDHKLFNTTDELCRCLDELLDNRPLGIALAQLKNCLFAKFQRDLVPERLGYRKLTDCLMCSSIQSICQLLALDSTTHRLSIVHRKFTSSLPQPLLKTLDNDSSEFRSNSSSSSLSLPPSPGSVSTAAPSEDSCSSLSLQNKTPDSAPPDFIPSLLSPQSDSKNFTHSSAANGPLIPYTAMSRAPSALTPISFLFLARSKQTPLHSSIKVSHMPERSKLNGQSSDDDDTISHVTHIALHELQKLVLPLSTVQQNNYATTNLSSINILYWDCFL